MGWKILLSFAFILIVFTLLFVYWVIPSKNIIVFDKKIGHSNFSLVGNSSMQFYPNMRYSDAQISYKISECPIGKEDEMLRAFNIISNLTILEFYSTSQEPEISVTCNSENKVDGEFFVAGEGGPVDITKTENFYVIQSGMVLLIRESQCPRPNIALHEIFHALGFDHSQNPNNIMFNISECEQTISSDMTDLVNTLYSIKSLPDLSFINVSASMSGRYLNLEISVRNNGLKKADESLIEVYGDGKLIKEIPLDGLEVGYGQTINITNLFVNKFSIDELKLSINSDFEELEKQNNEIILKTR